MTQEQIVCMKSQNWYPALKNNLFAFNGYTPNPDAFSSFSSYMNCFHWYRTPQGVGFWRDTLYGGLRLRII